FLVGLIFSLKNQNLIVLDVGNRAQHGFLDRSGTPIEPSFVHGKTKDAISSECPKRFDSRLAQVNGLVEADCARAVRQHLDKYAIVGWHKVRSLEHLPGAWRGLLKTNRLSIYGRFEVPLAVGGGFSIGFSQHKYFLSI